MRFLFRLGFKRSGGDRREELCFLQLLEKKSRIIKMKLLEAQFSSGTSSFTARYPCDTVRICLYTRLASGHLR
jgi:hypothetical protein